MERTRPAASLCSPEAITSAAPSVGRSAAYPGNGVLPEKSAAAEAMAVRPAQPNAICARAGSRASEGAPTASAAPSASSHARAAVEKYVEADAAAVECSDHASEA